MVGCSTIQNLSEKGLDSAKKAASNYVNKKSGSGTCDDMSKMTYGKDKIFNLLPYYVKANKMYDEKKITEVQKSDLKKQFDQKYADYKAGKIDLSIYNKQCTVLLDVKK